MSRFIRCAALAGLIGLGFAGSGPGARASVMAAPELDVMLDGVAVPGLGALLGLPGNADIFSVSADSAFLQNAGAAGTGVRLTQIALFGDPDPALTVAFNFQNLFGPHTVSIAFSIPLVPHLIDGVPVRVSSTLGITQTTGQGASSITPVAARIALIDIGTCVAGVDVGLGFAVPGGSATRNSAATAVFVPSAGCDSSLTETFAFVTNGTLATFAFTGSVRIDPIPEPLSLTLLGTALLGTVAVRRGRARSL